MKQTLEVSFCYSFNVGKAVNKKCSEKKVFWFFFFFQKFLKSTSEWFCFSYWCKLEGYTSTTKVIIVTSSYRMFQPDPQPATMQSYYFKKYLFLQHSLSSYFYRLHCWLLHYSASLWTNLLNSVCLTRLSLLSLIY